MKKPSIRLCLVIVPIVLGLAVVRLWGGAGPVPASDQAETPEAVTFDLRYRGLTSPDDALSYRSYWSFGGPDPTDVPFVEAVRKEVQDCEPVYNAILPDRQWSVVEFKDKKPVALYFDVNGDGKLSDDEKVLPAASSKAQPDHEFTFITPDFIFRQEDGREVPFRVMLVANSYGGDRMNYMWSPCCILEGQASLAGEPMRLFLYGDGFSGDGFSGLFNRFGGGFFSLVPAGQKLEEYLPRNSLSSLICYKDIFYRLKLDGVHEKDKTLRVTFTKDTSPTGRMAANITGTEGLKARLTQATIMGDEDTSIEFDLANMASPIPVGRYKLSWGYMGYGLQSDDPWRVDFGNGPRFAIEAGKTTETELGTLSLSVSAVDERERYNSNVKERATYPKGTPIYITPLVKGKGEEVYMRFSQKNAAGTDWTDVKPRVTILDAGEKQVVSADMEYG